MVAEVGGDPVLRRLRLGHVLRRRGRRRQWEEEEKEDPSDNWKAGIRKSKNVKRQFFEVT